MDVTIDEQTATVTTSKPVLLISTAERDLILSAFGPGSNLTKVVFSAYPGQDIEFEIQVV
jgi:hypothetical protein